MEATTKKKKFQFPDVYALIFILCCVAMILTWIIPAGEYARETVDVNGIERTVIKGDSFNEVTKTPQTWEVFSALFNPRFASML